MKERPIIYVRRITNLSDARYCAGMGANLLGFIANPDHPDYLTATQFKEIMGWVSGPSKVVELESTGLLNLPEIVNSYSPDFFQIELSESNPVEIPPASIPLIISVTQMTLPTLNRIIQNGKHNIAYLIVSQNENQSLINIISEFKIPILMILGQETKTLPALENPGVTGFVMQGSAELKPGLKDYDHLSIILEALDY